MSKKGNLECGPLIGTRLQLNKSDTVIIQGVSQLFIMQPLWAKTFKDNMEISWEKNSGNY